VALQLLLQHFWQFARVAPSAVGESDVIIFFATNTKAQAIYLGFAFHYIPCQGIIVRANF
jgi:hypothetical protein